MKSLDIFYREETAEKFKAVELNLEKKNIEPVFGDEKIKINEIKELQYISNKKLPAKWCQIFIIPTVLMFIIGILYMVIDKEPPIHGVVFIFFVCASVASGFLALREARIIKGTTEDEKGFYIHMFEKDVPELEKLMTEYDVKIEDERQKFEEKP